MVAANRWRINGEHRIVYRIEARDLLIAQLRYRYSNQTPARTPL
ncbi:type II toxin-antitoxin system YoeB family toxin [Synechococcus sp. CS-1324]|nr:type II toxin-antitoxin system YoeB family toxin [Synechococcus sp. CS-1324]